MLAALHVGTRLGQGENVGELGVGTRDAEEDEVRRYALGCTTGDNTVVLQQVGEENANDDKTGLQQKAISSIRSVLGGFVTAMPDSLYSHRNEEVGIADSMEFRTPVLHRVQKTVHLALGRLDAAIVWEVGLWSWTLSRGRSCFVC